MPTFSGIRQRTVGSRRYEQSGVEFNFMLIWATSSSSKAWMELRGLRVLYVQMRLRKIRICGRFGFQHLLRGTF